MNLTLLLFIVAFILLVVEAVRSRGALSTIALALIALAFAIGAGLRF